MNQEKVIELVAIHKKGEHFFLQIKMLFEEELEFFWRVDETIATQLQAVTNFEKKFKYRLAYYTFWNPTQKEYRSYITKTFLEHSERVYFSCSEEYINEIECLKQIQETVDIHALSFLSVQLPSKQDLKAEQSEEGQNEAEENSDKPSLRKMAWIASILIAICSIGYFEYMNLSFNKAGQVEAKESNSKVVMAATEKPKPKMDIKKASLIPITQKQKVPKTSTPIIHLSSTVNYGIPKGKVALTFDDGPSKYSKKIMNVLIKHKLKGTFFYIGMNVKQHPEYVKYANNHGFTIGSHTMHHAELTKLSYSKQESELNQGNQLIQKITGKPIVLFRPPYGAKNADTIKLAKKHHIKLVFWDVDTEDWKSRNAKKIIKSVEQVNTSGTIILLHENQATLTALPSIIEYLEKKHLEIVSLQD